MKQLGAMAAALSLATAARAASPWEVIADQDLQAIHDTVAANHAGPVDPQNPQYRVRLEQGLAAAREAAKGAGSFADYKRVVQAYTNGFRDGHLVTFMLVDTVSVEWPGFLPRLGDDGQASVGLSEIPAAAKGDVIRSCDGVPVDQLFERWVAPYYWNRDLPQERALQFPRTLMIDELDEARRVKACDLVHEGAVRHVKLEWRLLHREQVPDYRLHAAGVFIPKLGLRQVDGVWMLSLPNFWYPDSQAVDRFKALIEEVKQHGEVLRSAPKVVIDLRGNTGGMSAWGEEMAGALWGEAYVKAVAASIPETVDWRVSDSNLAYVDALIDRVRRDGLKDAQTELTGVRDAMLKARSQGEALAREDSPPAPPVTLEPTRPKGTVYVLTDSICASACLDFMDVILKMPGVVHVGLPTSADAVYIDNNNARLPSGLARLSYSMKVYRTRPRGNNQWYEPKIRWPGGDLTDEAVAAWIRGLP
jgi:hypothetical protein